MSQSVQRVLSEAEANKIRKDVVACSSKVVFTTHAEERMAARGIDRLQVLRVLGRGTLVEGPWFDPTKGTWTIAVRGISSGADLKVVAAIQWLDIATDSYIIVVTAYEV